MCVKYNKTTFKIELKFNIVEIKFTCLIKLKIVFYKNHKIQITISCNDA